AAGDRLQARVERSDRAPHPRQIRNLPDRPFVKTVSAEREVGRVSCCYDSSDGRALHWTGLDWATYYGSVRQPQDRETVRCGKDDGVRPEAASGNGVVACQLCLHHAVWLTRRAGADERAASGIREQANMDAVISPGLAHKSEVVRLEKRPAGPVEVGRGISWRRRIEHESRSLGRRTEPRDGDPVRE